MEKTTSRRRKTVREKMDQLNTKKQFNIGDTFTYYANPYQGISTIEDIYTTKNAAGKIVHIHYRAWHWFGVLKVYDLYTANSIIRSQVETSFKKS